MVDFQSIDTNLIFYGVLFKTKGTKTCEEEVSCKQMKANAGDVQVDYDQELLEYYDDYEYHLAKTGQQQPSSLPLPPLPPLPTPIGVHKQTHTTSHHHHHSHWQEDELLPYVEEKKKKKRFTWFTRTSYDEVHSFSDDNAPGLSYK